jgi:glycosyltransferase involved in cell wall biosynthesis
LLASRRGDFDVLWIGRPHNLRALYELDWAQPALLAGMRIVYDAEAVFAERTIGAAALAGAPLSGWRQQRLLRAELRMTEIAEAIVAVSASEQSRIAEVTGRAVRLLSHGAALAPTPSPFEARRDLLFLGAVRDADTPNGDSLRYFLREVMPGLAVPGGMRLRIAGAGTDRAAWLNGHRGPQVDLVGPVPDLAPLFDAVRVFVAPTRYAAGIPIKVIDAARHGVPVVASSLVAGQLGWRHGIELLTADTAPEFAAACVALYSDPALWARVRAAALAAAERDFDPGVFAAGVCAEAHATCDSRRQPQAPAQP